MIHKKSGKLFDMIWSLDTLNMIAHVLKVLKQKENIWLFLVTLEKTHGTQV